MRASELGSRKKPRTNLELQQSAVEFIKDGMARKPAPPWKREDGSYQYDQALRAHMASLPLSKLDQHNKRQLLMKIHQKIWLEHQGEVIKKRIDDLNKEYDRIRQRLSSLRVFMD